MEKYNNEAGSIRNVKMLKEENPDFVLGFPGAKGTLHCLKSAEKFNIPNLYLFSEEFSVDEFNSKLIIPNGII